jgi:peroxiredoxin
MKPYPSVGDQAPLLKLPTEAGSMFSLEEVRGRPTLVTFLSHAA